MNAASSVPMPDYSWGATSPDQSVLHLEYRLQHSPGTSMDKTDIGLYVCHLCNKHYSRHCDLNKHIKTHNRSFKCPVEGCRYNTFGWPTEKELERHHNDKHSAAPKVFSCWYQPCTYTSKRESNCKQHMEKTHGWQYVRTRPGNRDEGSNHSESAAHGDTIFVSEPASVDLDLRAMPDFLLTPSPLEQRLSTPQDTPLPVGLDGTVQYAPGVYGPWTSPVTPLGNHAPFVGTTGHPYASDSPGPTRGNELLKIPVDPLLSHGIRNESPRNNAAHASPAATGREAMLKTLPTIVTATSSPAVKGQVLTPTSDVSPALFSTTALYTGVTHPGGSESASTPGASSTQPLNTRASSLRRTDGKRHVRPSNDSDSDDYDDEEPPTKRNRGPEEGEAGQMGDPKMICPFRAAYPDKYNRDVDPKYASCHTEHMNISTVVRHLGRPAHNLKVDNSRSTISSFEIAYPGYEHPAAGLCKTCWTPFNDLQAFENHKKNQCPSASRSKREKLILLRDTFCPMPATHEEESPEKGKAREVGDATLPGTVSRGEFVELVQRVTELERMLAIKMPRATPRVAPQQAQTVVRAFSSSPALPSLQSSQPFGFYGYSGGAGPSRAMGGNDFAQQSSGILRHPLAEPEHRALHPGKHQSNMPAFEPNAAPTSDHHPRLTTAHNAPVATRRASQQQRRLDANLVSRRAGISAYGPVAAAEMTTEDHQARPGTAARHNELQLAGNQAGQAFETGETSQESTNTAMRNQWDHAVQVSDEMLGMFGNAPGDDMSKYLDMESN